MALEAHIPDQTWFIGSPLSLVFSLFQADGVTPQDVTGWSLSWSLRRWAGEADPALIQKTTDEGIALTTPGSGIVTVSLTRGDTEGSPTALRPGLYRHALKRTDDGVEIVLSFGLAILKHVAAH